MLKVLSIYCVFSTLLVGILFYMYKQSQKENAVLESEKKGLINIVKGYQNAEVEANITIKELRGQLLDKNNLDWYNTAIPADLLDSLRKRHNRNRKN